MQSSQRKLAGCKWRFPLLLLGQDEGDTVLDVIGFKVKPVLQDTALELQLLLLAWKAPPVFNLLFQVQDEVKWMNGVGVAPTIRVFHKDLDLRGDGVQQTDVDVGEDSVIGQ
ncbi:hypothetical protein I79_010333 [Cricetulus griseus]|uniref:Uncharacterized protein n=1 Tax=Cricetulus griseus TaxID=10029 RepID=G3HI66_CRIGR|nr:hypothetical protein I79_010333 [Cricetulus griseus]